MKNFKLSQERIEIKKLYNQMVMYFPQYLNYFQCMSDINTFPSSLYRARVER